MDKVNYTKLHQIVLNIYKEFQSICEAHHLNYYAISGTTLGAVLWQGIIPWDDDMDIAMPAKDYEKFVKICQKSLPKHLSFTEYIWFGGKLHDNRTTFTNINYINNPDRYNGIFIDIVPLIALPNDENERNAFVENLKSFQKFGLLFDRYQDQEYGLSKLLKWKKEILHQYKFGTTDYVMDFSDPRYVLDAKGFLNPTVVKFEDTTIPISSNAEADLHIQYGNYTKYPPSDARQSIHELQSIIRLTTPYKEIAKEYKQLPIWVQSMFNKKNSNEGFYLKSLYYNQDLARNHSNDLAKCKDQLDQANHKLSQLRQQIIKHPLKAIYQAKQNKF